ncbi:thiamine phosphate synthase [Paenibacillus sp. CAA11]|uniref:thiamine phosphate synthase n=1 Tax=Paenibacillus sp. CAA11 TaxID=1532905 RepID=UPI000D3328D3|nr:thiamine phosphate synthase [Paenibacillus sp. CAA11]AWB43537.1 thiamine phosphate synthase [Paenibacillus sp. CAA11]
MTGRWSASQVRELLRMYLVVGSQNCRSHPLEVVEEALAGGATLVQFREKGPGALRGAPLKELARELQAACRRAGVPFIVNDDVELALSIDADGVHVGQDDEDAGRVRVRIGEGRILGVSAHSVEDARRAAAGGADYLGIGPIYPTGSKDDARAVQGPSILRELRASGIELPLVGIGGITASRVEEVIHAGADGIAVISAITQAEASGEAARQLSRLVSHSLAGRLTS